MLALALLERDGEASRARILSALRRSPGMNQAQLCREVGLSWATVRYHLRRLKAQGAVHLERRGRRDLAWFPVSVPAKYRAWLAALVDDPTRRLLLALRGGEAGVASLSKRLGMSESATRRRLQRLKQGNAVVQRGVLRPRFAARAEVTRWLEEREGPESVDAAETDSR